MNKQALSIGDVTGTSTISFPTKELLELFGLPDLEPEDMYMDIWPDDEELLDTVYLDISWDEEQESWLDKTGQPLKDEVIDEIKRAIVSAVESKTMANYTKRVRGALEEILYTFSNFEYEYDFINEAGSYEGMHDTAIGITNITIDYDNTTTITTDNDLVHVINTCITGVGLFNVDEELEGAESFAEYIQSRFHWLKSYWKIFGTRIPKPDLDHIEDFDKKYFKELLKDIEKTFNVSIT